MSTGRLREKSTVDNRFRDRRWLIGEEKGKKKKKKKRKRRKKEEKKKNLLSTHRPRPHAVAARGSPARRRHPRLRALFLPCEEMEHLPAR
ncbi:hypothetical protein GW17_00052636 [Ensete ventricosum]|nr:hypothetical protein GW17_00052636 [Ensete ventricosum]